MRKPVFANATADQLHSKYSADQWICVQYMDSTIPLVSLIRNLKFEASNIFYVAVQPGLSKTWSVFLF